MCRRTARANRGLNRQMNGSTRAIGSGTVKGFKGSNDYSGLFNRKNF